VELGPDDSVLVEMLRKGDIDAFNSLYKRYSRKLYAFGLKYLRSTEESEELLQSVFFKIWENHKILKKDSSFKSYLFTIAYNDICNTFRKRNYQQKFISDYRYENSQASLETENSIDYNSVLELVEKAVNRLPEKKKQIFLKSRNEGKSTKEIAEEFGLSHGTVDNYISESLKSIRCILKNEPLAIFLFCSLFLI
jgi:RNA polymerase sigma-70 factor (family 1)